MKITYFYKEGCPFSRMTHTAVNRMVGGSGRNVQLEKVCVDKNPMGYKNSLSRLCGTPVTTFPQIFVNDQYVGGYSDFARLFPNVI